MLRRRQASKWFVTVCVAAAACASGQDGSSEGTRQLYYLAVSPKDSLPPVANVSPKSQAPKASTMHLGLRYNLVLEHPQGTREPFTSDRALKAGDCFALELQANHSGYLYVLAKQSSGAWLPLLPSAEMPDESNVIDPGKKILVPSKYCLEIRDPPGTETLIVVLSRDPRDFYELYEGIKGKLGAAQMATAVAHMQQQFGTRDIAIKKLAEPEQAGEAKGSVYVVSSSNKPTASITTEIRVRHR